MTYDHRAHDVSFARVPASVKILHVCLQWVPRDTRGYTSIPVSQPTAAAPRTISTITIRRFQVARAATCDAIGSGHLSWAIVRPASQRVWFRRPSIERPATIIEAGGVPLTAASRSTVSARFLAFARSFALKINRLLSPFRFFDPVSRTRNLNR